jgi:hypothetical protein
MSHKQNARQNHNINIANGSFENVARFKYLEQNLIHQKMKSRFNLGDACYISAYYDLFSRLLYKNVKFTIHEAVM